MKTTLLLLVFFTATWAKAQQTCAIDDGNGNVVDEMTVDKGRSLKGSLVLRNEFKGYNITAVFTSQDQQLAIITAQKGSWEISAAGVQLSVKEAGKLIFTVTCGN